MRTRCQCGFTLMEVLIAMLLLAIGVIGAAGTQLTALRTRHGSALMSDGVQLASSLADRMRANATQMLRPDGANPYLRLRYDSTDGAPPAPARLCYAVADCSSDEIAQFDTYEVALALHAHYPGGRVAVCRDNALWDSASDRLTWDCAGGAQAPLVIKLGWNAARGRGLGAVPGPAQPALAIVVGAGAP